MTPWEHHTDLQRERLVEIGRLIQQGRRDALDRMDLNAGSNPWTVGCEAFAFGCHQITDAAVVHDWLVVVQPGMQFVFRIGDVLVRFYRGAPDEPNKRTLKQSYSEIHQPSLFGMETFGSSELLYRFAVETDYDGSVLAITFVVLAGETAVLAWNIPLEEHVVRVASIGVPQPEGVELRKPTVQIPGREKQESDDTAG